MPPSPVTLLCLCASHISTADRADYLGHLLVSVSAQTCKKFKLFVGISFENEDLRKQVDTQLKSSDSSTIHVFLFSKKHTQFERYNAVLNALRNRKYITPEQEPNTYVSFTDDDDLWSPQRMMAFRQGAERLHTDKRNPTYMFTIKHFNMDIEMRDFIHWDQLPMKEENFFGLAHPREYCDILCKFTLFAHWFDVASPELLAHPFCDMALTKWITLKFTIKDNERRDVDLRMNCPVPLYYYRQSDRNAPFYSQKASRRPSVSEVEEMMSQLLLHRQLYDCSWDFFFFFYGDNRVLKKVLQCPIADR